MSNHAHPWHLVEPSPWPYVGAMGAFGMTVGGVMYFHGYKSGDLLLFFSFMIVILVMIAWWSDVMSEATYQGHHTLMVQKGLSMGMLLFILSEVCFFFSFFWAFFHSSLSPAMDIGAIWPPVGMQAFNPFEVPLLNTAILMSSGATVTWSHHALVSGNSKDSMLALIFTVVLGLMFTALQGLEYYEATFSMADSVYGSTFFVATGFHGLHVIMGSTFLIVCLFSLMNHQFTKHHHNGFEASIWYWHFVDYVWMFLFISIYWWGY